VRFLIRILQRAAILGLGVLSVCLIVFVFRWVDSSLSVTYGLAAYVILPRAVRMGLKILQRRHVPRFTVTADGLPGDPVNLALIGTLGQLRAAFATAGWAGADRLNLASSWRMARAFVLNEPYPTAPFSTLYLFGRGQDFAFSGRSITAKRHHVRFWAKTLAQVEADVCTKFLAQHRPTQRR
jgi:LssY C-terminus